MQNCSHLVVSSTSHGQEESSINHCSNGQMWRIYPRQPPYNLYQTPNANLSVVSPLILTTTLTHTESKKWSTIFSLTSHIGVYQPQHVSIRAMTETISLSFPTSLRTFSLVTRVFLLMATSNLWKHLHWAINYLQTTRCRVLIIFIILRRAPRWHMNGRTPGHLLGYKLLNICALRMILSRLLKDIYGECLCQQIVSRRCVSTQNIIYRLWVCSLIGCLCQFVAVHIRRGDFGRDCDGGSNKCFIPLATFKKKVDNMIMEILETKNIDVDKVIVMSGMFVFPEILFSVFLAKIQRRTGSKVLGRSEKHWMGSLQSRGGRHSGAVRWMVSSYRRYGCSEHGDWICRY